MNRPRRLLVFKAALGDGGADRVAITLLHKLDRAEFTPTLLVNRRGGALEAEVPADVDVIELGARRIATAAPALARTLRKHDPDIVLSLEGGANPVVAAAHWVARSRARLVLSERSSLRRPDHAHGLRGLTEIPMKRLAYRRADCVAAVSDGVAAELCGLLGLPPATVTTVYNPIVDDALRAAAELPVEHPFPSDDRPVVVAVGRMVPVKDYPTLLRAWRIIHAATGARLWLLGDGPERGALEAEVRARGLGAEVAFLGFDANPARYMRRATVLLQASLAEGLPGTLIQSLAVGTPVVSTDCDHGPREVVRDGVDGFLVPVGEAHTLAARAITLITEPAVRAQFSAAGRIRAARYDVAASMARYRAALLGERHG